MVTVTTILVPAGADPEKVVAYATPEDSAAVKCAPSYNSKRIHLKFSGNHLKLPCACVPVQFGSSVEDFVLSFAGDEVFFAPLLLQGLLNLS